MSHEDAAARALPVVPCTHRRVDWHPPWTSRGAEDGVDVREWHVVQGGYCVDCRRPVRGVWTRGEPELVAPPPRRRQSSQR